MGKRSRNKGREAVATAEGEVGPRQPCPCGSGRRYKACHGATDGPPPVFNARPFGPYAGECDLIAMRELVPAATAPLTLSEASGHAGKVIRLNSLLPGAAPAMVRDTGEIWLGLQVQHNFGDPGRDLGAVLLKALESEAGIVGLTEAPGEGPRFTDLVVDEPLQVTVHDGFEFWVDDIEDQGPAMAAALEQANAAASPTVRLGSVDAAYWTRLGAKEHLRWVMPEPEDDLLAGLARLHVSGDDVIADGARLVGMFRAHGLLVPVWDLPVGTGAEILEEPAAAFARALADAVAAGPELSAEERAARSGLANRQVTIR
ncbi:DUF5926 domain-containing protein [Nocardioides dubius]|uniref:DUF5926 family protein n=1 Tax=Nocardioides dubius TaxID=317019 RepID=A0ABP4EEY8_9ACTN